MLSLTVVLEEWEFKGKWKCCRINAVMKSKKVQNQGSTIVDLKNLKAKMGVSVNFKPYIICFGFDKIDENEFTKVFPDFKKLILHPLDTSVHPTLAYARFLSNETAFSMYSTSTLLDRNVEIKLNDETICVISGYESLPFSTTVPVQTKLNDLIKIIEGEDIIAFSMPITDEGNYDIDMTFDINGIYTLNVKRSGMIKLIKAEKAENILTPPLCKYTIPLKNDSNDPILNAIGIDLGTTECCAAVIRRTKMWTNCC
uniref:Uncharacterized protein n=1 Tax=Panagrolaimus superbus TaxID=310955 RepID=A0A914Y9Y8_9BILA